MVSRWVWRFAYGVGIAGVVVYNTHDTSKLGLIISAIILVLGALKGWKD